jgi:hypothetical protein
MGAQENLGYNVAVRPGVTPTSFTVQVTNNQSRVDYQGLLIYVTTLGNTNIHYGKWTFRNQTKWKYQDPAACQRANVQGPLESTMTHALPARVPTSVLFTWTASSIQEASIPGLIVSAVVANTEGGRPRWQRLDFVPIGTGGPAPDGQNGLPGAPGQPTDPNAPGSTPTDVSPVGATTTRTNSASTIGSSLLLGLVSLFL